MSQNTHFIIQFDKNGYYKLHQFKGRDEKTLHENLCRFFIVEQFMSLMIPLQEILLRELYVNLHHFRKPSYDGHEWFMISATKEKREKEERYVLILQRSTEGLYLPISIDDIHKMPQKLISYDKTMHYIRSYMDEALQYETRGSSTTHNIYNKTISLFTLMLDSIDLNISNKKRRFY